MSREPSTALRSVDLLRLGPVTRVANAMDRIPVRDSCHSSRHSRRFSRYFGTAKFDVGLTARMADRAVLIEFRRFLTVIHNLSRPPDKQEKATRTVLEQAEVLSDGWPV